MANSLQDQLLKAGLVDSKKAKQVQRQKKKQTKQQHKSGVQAVDETKLAAQQAQREKADKDREMNRQRLAEAEHKAIAAQIKQLIESNRQPRNGEIGYSFSHDNKIKKIYVDARQQKQLERGILAVVVLGDQFELVAAPVAEKVAQRDADYVALLNNPKEETSSPDSDDEYYAQFEIPDDLMW
ncbi:DUF2058 domain-containing protein [Porticoccus sp. W117]|uniref:DUF2058 domain-containing protein n=1 Tax=Porticoccus sp. W117 TaxID=3054777 RepID=UPI0025946236|nr:DUF2058 domain-containing protein [Porticoccus sp. W117]MDM3871216.1 DUF2058 domain-containing protein [Porticoccus sp. W117]